ncbi:MAG TPA: integrase, partial [Micromonosporaceae bacterium]|nr:integrase [Micromonosporaceae bacterium]
MAAIRTLECPLQRCALLIARWSGARRGEIRRLHLDSLDSYPDGTPRLRLAAGKSLKERTVPVHPEAAHAI